MRAIRSFLRDAWRLAKPYYASDEKWSAWGLLISILALRLLLVGMTVILSFWNREFFNSLQDKNFAAFFELLFVYRYTPSGARRVWSGWRLRTRTVARSWLHCWSTVARSTAIRG